MKQSFALGMQPQEERASFRKEVCQQRQNTPRLAACRKFGELMQIVRVGVK